MIWHVSEEFVGASIRGLAATLSPAGSRARLLLLIYHRVLTQPDLLLPNEVDAEAFDRQMAFMAANFAVLPLSEAAERLRARSLPARAACITFDDGYADNATVALPILVRHRLPASFFIATGFLDGGIMFNDAVMQVVRRASAPTLDLRKLGLESYPLDTLEQRLQAASRLIANLKYRPSNERNSLAHAVAEIAEVILPRDLMMRSNQVGLLHESGMEVGAHTVSHPILARLSAKNAREEIAASKEQLEGLINAPVSVFAYPNGIPGKDYAPEHVRLTRDIGFRAAVSTVWGVGDQNSDPYQLPRFTPWDKATTKFGMRLVFNYVRRQDSRRTPLADQSYHRH